MAGIMIRGMEMPKSCFECPFMYARSYCLVNSKLVFDDPNYSELKGRYNGCPLVPLPERHGRLIDADALAESVMQAVGTRGSEEWILELIEEAETIVDAREVTDNG